VKQDQIEAEIIAARERLAKNLSEIEYALSSEGLKNRGKELAKNFFTHPDGEYRIERIIGAAIGTVLSLKIFRKIF
jgi:Zn-dependent protease with chaperone function